MIGIAQLCLSVSCANKKASRLIAQLLLSSRVLFNFVIDLSCTLLLRSLGVVVEFSSTVLSTVLVTLFLSFVSTLSYISFYLEFRVLLELSCTFSLNSVTL